MGVDPEKSCEAFLEAVRAGDVPPRLVAALAAAGAVGTGSRPYYLRPIATPVSA